MGIDCTRKLVIACCFGALTLAFANAGSKVAPSDRQLRISVTTTVDKAAEFLNSDSRADDDVWIILLSDVLFAKASEFTLSGGDEALVDFAQKNGVIVGAPTTRLRTGAAESDLALSIALVEPGGTFMAESVASPPIPPILGSGYAHGNFRHVSNVANIEGYLIGVATISNSEAAIARFSDRGADLVLLAGSPVSDAQIARLSRAARTNRIALVVAGRCPRKRDCVIAVAIDANGMVRRTDANSFTFRRPERRAPPGAKGLPNFVPQPNGLFRNSALEELGRVLFFDRNVSDSGSVSCASCHVPSLGFTDDRPLGVGAHGRPTARNVISVINAAFYPVLRWDGYPSTLENFVKYPMSDFNEMDTHDLDDIVNRLGRSGEYRERFAQAFGSEQINFRKIESALAAYMRTLISGDSPFDRAMAGGSENAMSESAWRGYAVFNGRGGCSTCHTYSKASPFFTDFDVHNTGLGWDSASSNYRDAGAGAIFAGVAPGSFRTPTLRDVARTPPYMHDGSLATLRDVIDYFDRGGGAGPGRDRQLKPLHLSDREKNDLEAFLIALTGSTRFGADGRRTE